MSINVSDFPVNKTVDTNESYEKFSSSLIKIKRENINRIVFAQININSIRNKFDMLSSAINGNIDILVITETKIDNSFPTQQFLMTGYSAPFRFDRNQYGGGLLVYFRDDIPCRLIKNKSISIEVLFVEINLRKSKWLLCCSYNPHRSLISKHLEEVQKTLDVLSSRYERFLLIGDYNCEITDSKMIDFCQIYDLSNLIKESTCFKNPDKPSCIDLMLTNRPKSFIKSMVIETDLSDFHKMTLTIMKSFFPKKQPNITQYRDFRNFSNESFCNDLLFELSVKRSEASKCFQTSLRNVFNSHVAIKSRYVRANQSPFINKTIAKAIMNRSKLRKRYFSYRSDFNKRLYNRQRNYCLSLIRKTKKAYFNSLKTDTIVNSKTFWKTVKPFLSDKSLANNKITLIENDEIISNETKLAETFNNYFVNIVPSLGIHINDNLIRDVDYISDPIVKIIEKFKDHPSIISIHVNNRGNNNPFSFTSINNSFLDSLISTLDSSKSCQMNDIPISIIKKNVDIIVPVLCQNINYSFMTSCFPEELKIADVIPIFKKDSKTEKSNYRPVSILSNVSKIYELCIYDQLSKYFDGILSDFQFGFRKGFSAQQCLIALIELWKKSVDNKEAFGALMTDLSKAFDCVDHDLLIAKLSAYGLNFRSLKLVYNYLNDRKQRVKVNNSYSSLKCIRFGVPQGSVLGPLLFNVYICDLFYIIKDWKVANYADDTTPYVVCKNMTDVIHSLENCATLLFEWFENNNMKANSDKSHLLLSTSILWQAKITNDVIQNCQSEKLLGIIIDNKLNFQEHVNSLCDKASQKFSALARLSYYMDTNQKRRILKAFITSQFGYCPLIWMFCSRTLNNRINRIHERALRIDYNDSNSSFDELLLKDNSVSIHTKNLQVLCIEIYKVRHQLSSNILSEVFKVLDKPYNFRRNTIFDSRNIHTEHFGIDSLSYLGPKLWSQIPNEIKDSESLNIFKSKIKSWKPSLCPCRLCKIYVPNLGYASVS